MILNKTRRSLVCVLLPIIMIFAFVIPASAATGTSGNSARPRLTILIESTYDEAQVLTPPEKEPVQTKALEKTQTVVEKTVKTVTSDVASTAVINTVVSDETTTTSPVIDATTTTFRVKAQHQSRPDGLHLIVKTSIA